MLVFFSPKGSQPCSQWKSFFRRSVSGAGEIRLLIYELPFLYSSLHRVYIGRLEHFYTLILEARLRSTRPCLFICNIYHDLYLQSIIKIKVKILEGAKVNVADRNFFAESSLIKKAKASTKKANR